MRYIYGLVSTRYLDIFNAFSRDAVNGRGAHWAARNMPPLYSKPHPQAAGTAQDCTAWDLGADMRVTLLFEEGQRTGSDRARISFRTGSRDRLRSTQVVLWATHWRWRACVG